LGTVPLFSKIAVGDSAPTDKSALWLDTSQYPPRWKVYSEAYASWVELLGIPERPTVTMPLDTRSFWIAYSTGSYPDIDFVKVSPPNAKIRFEALRAPSTSYEGVIYRTAPTWESLLEQARGTESHVDFEVDPEHLQECYFQYIAGLLKFLTTKTNEARKASVTVGNTRPINDVINSAGSASYTSSTSFVEVSKIDLGSVMTIEKLAAVIGAYTTNAADTAEVKAQYSTDGVAWTDIETGKTTTATSIGSANSWTVAVENVSARYVKVIVRNAGTGTYNVYGYAFKFFAWR